VRDRLRRGDLPTDEELDGFLRPRSQRLSRQFWTPVSVAAKVARWVGELGVGRVLDIGSGSGKLCVVAAACCDAAFVGIEQRKDLADEATALASRFGLSDRVSFVNGSLGEVPLPDVDAYYLYNPFGENVFGPESHIDETVELSDRRYFADVARVEALLREAKVGTALVTYNGFGGTIPGSFCEVAVDRKRPSVLRLWQKTSRVATIAHLDDD
jgi:predicted RNA methylase